MTKATYGLYGLGTMGSALALNILDNGFALHVSNRTDSVVREFEEEAGGQDLAGDLTGHDSLGAMIDAMDSPRVVILMVPAGKAVDATLDDLWGMLEEGDTIIDGGNSDFNDTRRRTDAAEDKGLNYIGMGVSGGEEGARHGPSIMVGGTPEAWEHVRPVITAIAAEFEGAPCADHLGPDGAGHFVKTVHNGIEYAEMQLIAEVYGLLRNGAGMPPGEIGQIFGAWNEGPLKSYLVEITAKILAHEDHHTGGTAVDAIVDSAGQKGTGRWTVIEALKLGQSASAIEAAVGARAWSAARAARKAGEGLFDPARAPVAPSRDGLERALMAARIIDHAQGFEVLRAASEAYEWSLDMARVAEVWRAGCIIRSALLDDIAAAFRADPPHGLLAFGDGMVERLEEGVPALREIVAMATAAAHPVPAMSAALAWFDTMTEARGTAALIQAQRDFFGKHGFERVDGRDDPHGPWWH